MIDRYSRQISFIEIGEQGQKRLGSSSVAIIGCGGLGSIIATSLVRAGVGKVKIIDRGFLEYHNLHRQILYDEDDVCSHLPKAVAAERHLKKVNSSVEVEGIVADLNRRNIEGLLSGADLILDASDNFETRFVINDTCLKHKIPWVYGGVAGSYGMSMNIIPGETPCLRCVYHGPPAGNITSTHERVGIIGPAPIITGSFQSVEAMKILIGVKGINRDLIIADIWKGTFYRIKITLWRECPSCQGKYEFLAETTLRGGMK
jgi:adenylyltransferase/sulfurtransferase